MPKKSRKFCCILVRLGNEYLVRNTVFRSIYLQYKLSKWKHFFSVLTYIFTTFIFTVSLNVTFGILKNKPKGSIINFILFPRHPFNQGSVWLKLTLFLSPLQHFFALRKRQDIFILYYLKLYIVIKNKMKCFAGQSFNVW